MLLQPSTLETPGYKKIPGTTQSAKYAPLLANYAKYSTTQYTSYITVIKHRKMS